MKGYVRYILTTRAVPEMVVVPAKKHLVSKRSALLLFQIKRFLYYSMGSNGEEIIVGILTH